MLFLFACFCFFKVVGTGSTCMVVLYGSDRKKKVFLDDFLISRIATITANRLLFWG